MRFFTILFYITIASIPFSVAQRADSSLTSRHIEEMPVSHYREVTSISQNLYNGRLYYVYDARQEEHQFFESRKWTKGNLFYDGQRYDSVQMLYDIVRDEVIIKHFNGENLLLQPAKLSYFSLLHHNYRRLVSGVDIEAGMRTGFYDMIYQGPSNTIVRRIKQRQEKIVDKKVITLFPPKNFYYIWKDGHYHFVHTKKSLMALFPEHQKILKKSLREQNIRFRKERESAIVKTVALYDQLSKK